MKLIRPLLFLSCVLGVTTSGMADSLRFAGVLGNSGEQGDTLVRFGPKPASGLGVVYDRFGSLWDRGGDGVLNRYSVDGRQLATYRIAPSPGRGTDAITHVSDELMLKLGEKIYTLNIAADGNTEPSPLPIKANRLSLSTSGGQAAASFENEVFLVNPSGEKVTVTEIADKIQDVEMGPDGAVFAVYNKSLYRIDQKAPADARGPWTPPGDRAQWLDGYWYGSSWHGTIRRFSPDLKPDPGVVLGGGSGSFIGHVDGNYELTNSRGLAHLGERLFASSGVEGVLHLLEWISKDKQFKIIRRIGALTRCNGLGLDSKGRIWCYGGMWEWSDGPDAPLRQGVPPGDNESIGTATVLDNDVMVAPAMRNGKSALYAGPLGEPLSTFQSPLLPPDGTISALVTWNKKLTTLVLNSKGKGVGIFIGTDGKPLSAAGEIDLQTATHINQWTSLSAFGDKLIGAADGQVIELSREGDIWKETQRWNSWGDGPEARLGQQIFLTVNQGRLWISDTERQRIVCLDPANRQLIATFGMTDQAGNDLKSLSAPRVLSANGRRAVAFDSGNQRLVRLELE